MPFVPQVYGDVFLARPRDLIWRSTDGSERSDYLNLEALSRGGPHVDRASGALFQNTVIALQMDGGFVPAMNQPENINTEDVHFLDLAFLPSFPPHVRNPKLPYFPNLIAVHITPDSAFAPAPFVLHTTLRPLRRHFGSDPRAPFEWKLNPFLAPPEPRPGERRGYHTPAIKEIVFDIHLRSPQDIINSDLDKGTWTLLLRNLAHAVQYAPSVRDFWGRDPGRGRRDKLCLFFRIRRPPPTPGDPGPEAWSHRSAAISHLGIVAGWVEWGAEFHFVDSDEWDVAWLHHPLIGDEFDSWIILKFQRIVSFINPDKPVREWNCHHLPLSGFLVGWAFRENGLLQFLETRSVRL